MIQKEGCGVKKVKVARIMNGLKQCDVAEVLGVSRQMYNKKENGNSSFSLEQALIVAKLFGTTTEELFYDEVVNSKLTSERA